MTDFISSWLDKSLFDEELYKLKTIQDQLELSEIQCIFSDSDIEHAKLNEVLVLVLDSRKRKIKFLPLSGESLVECGKSFFKEYFLWSKNL